MDSGVEYIEQRADRLQRELEDAQAELKRVELFADEAMRLAVNGPGQPSRELWVWWRTREMRRQQAQALLSGKAKVVQ
jgi:hypothetical protein